MAFQMNPQMRKLHEKHQKPAELGKPMEAPPAVEGAEEEPTKGHVEVHGHGGGFHTMTHQPHEMADGEPQEDGSVKHDHADLEMVKQHMQKHFGEELAEAKGEEDGMGGEDY